jgi:formylglycine-generating enzyme required for sulfatase activity
VDREPQAALSATARAPSRRDDIRAPAVPSPSQEAQPGSPDAPAAPAGADEHGLVAPTSAGGGGTPGGARADAGGDDIPSWAVVAPEQRRAARAAGVPVAFENALGMRFVLVPAGTFRMGSPHDEAGRWDNETPHEVTLSRPYYLGTTEVTNSQFLWFRPHHASGQGRDADAQPVVRVGRRDAIDFLAWLSAKDGRRAYRLPTEAEWERACRAGTTTPWATGSSITGDQANFVVRTGRDARPEEFRRTTVFAGSLPANRWGLHEMHGNVREWCADAWAAYPAGPVTDPAGAPDGLFGVMRGGSWHDGLAEVRCALRGIDSPAASSEDLGFRAAASLPPP